MDFYQDNNNEHCDDWEEEGDDASLAETANSYYSIDQLSTIWEENSQDLNNNNNLSSSFSTINSQSPHPRSDRSKAVVLGYRNKIDIDSLLLEKASKPASNEEETDETVEESDDDDDDDDDDDEPDHEENNAGRQSLDSFFSGTSGKKTNSNEQQDEEQPKRRTSLGAFLSQSSTHEHDGDDDDDDEQDANQKLASLEQFLSGNANDDAAIPSADFMRLVSYLTGEEVLIPESEDDEYTFVSYTSTVVSDLQSFVSESGATFLSEAPSLYSERSIADMDSLAGGEADDVSTATSHSAPITITTTTTTEQTVSGEERNPTQTLTTEDEDDAPKRQVPRRTKSCSSDILLRTILEDEED